jgi:hypothetical protein
LAHEIGHFIDAQLGRDNQFGTLSRLDLFGEWEEAAKNSGALQDLRRAKVSKATKEYLLSTQEVWARSYAQYVTTRSGSQTLGKELYFNRGFGQKGALWEDDDFEPVGAAIDGIFRKLGWLK